MGKTKIQNQGFLHTLYDIFLAHFSANHKIGMWTIGLARLLACTKSWQFHINLGQGSRLYGMTVVLINVILQTFVLHYSRNRF